MAGNSDHSLRAEDLLRESSEREALDLDIRAHATPHPTTPESETLLRRYTDILKRPWNRYVVITVSPAQCRDHFANERTALGYIRTAQAFAMTGVITSQVMRLMRSLHPDPVLGFFVISIPFAAICHFMALLICILGLYRFLHWQNQMARGFAISSGWELTTIFVLSTLILVCIFVLVITITARNPDR